MSQLEEQILKQNVLEEHRQVHELQLRIKELRADVERYVTINAQQAERAEKAEAELAKLRGQEPVAYVKYKATGGNVGLAWMAIPTQVYYPREGEPLYAAAIPAPAVPRKYHEFATVMLDAQPFITAETYGGRYIVAMRFEGLGKMQDCHAALLAMLQSADGYSSQAQNEVRHD